MSNDNPSTPDIDAIETDDDVQGHRLAMAAKDDLDAEDGTDPAVARVARATR